MPVVAERGSRCQRVPVFLQCVFRLRRLSSCVVCRGADQQLSCRRLPDGDQWPFLTVVIRDRQQSSAYAVAYELRRQRPCGQSAWGCDGRRWSVLPYIARLILWYEAVVVVVCGRQQLRLGKMICQLRPHAVTAAA